MDTAAEDMANREAKVREYEKRTGANTGMKSLSENQMVPYSPN